MGPISRRKAGVGSAVNDSTRLVGGTLGVAVIGSVYASVYGYHFSSPRIVEVAPGVRVAQGYDFADFAFVSTGSGVVAIDAGTAERRVRAALATAGLHAEDVSHVILTHAHFDHVGGIGALTGPGTQVIAQADFPSELRRQHANRVPFAQCKYIRKSSTTSRDGRI
jgi:glyoxylase-like metal-dependent hydrolase (beta-lactamase superfamily II)